MTYSPGSSGYPPGFYGATTPSFAKSVDSDKPQPYLTGAVIVLGLLAYLASYGKMFTTMLPGGEELVQTGGGFPVAAALLAALLAATSLLPKAKSYAPVVAAISALGALMLVENTVSASGRGWALWFVLACTVLQAFAAAAVVLLDAASSARRRRSPNTTSTASTASTVPSRAATTVSRCPTRRRARSSPATGRTTAATRPRRRPADSDRPGRSNRNPDPSRERPLRRPASRASAHPRRPVPDRARRGKLKGIRVARAARPTTRVRSRRPRVRRSPSRSLVLVAIAGAAKRAQRAAMSRPTV